MLHAAREERRIPKFTRRALEIARNEAAMVRLAQELDDMSPQRRALAEAEASLIAASAIDNWQAAQPAIEAAQARIETILCEGQ